MPPPPCSRAQEVLSFLVEVLDSTPQSLGDPKKEAPEELQDRHERATCSALALLGTLAGVAGQEPAAEGSKVGPEGDAALIAAAS